MAAATRKFLRSGQFEVSRRPAVLETLVGSCVTVCLYNRYGRFGAMNHFLRDRPKDDSDVRIGTYGSTATRHIIEAVLRIDSDPTHYRAYILGGAAVLKTAGDEYQIGSANVVVAEQVLRAARIRVAQREVGGTRGRRVRFHTETGELEWRFAGDIPRKKPVG